MGQTAGTLLAIAVVLPLLLFLIYLAFRNLTASLRNVRDAVNATTSTTKQPPKPTTPPLSADAAAELLKLSQEQANKSDAAHKARIRAHVDRKVPPMTEEGRSAIDRARTARLGIKHLFPPRLPQRGMSYFGGLPIVPEDFDWPTLHNQKGRLERLNFMAQIDCSDLPPGPARDLLPDRGYLFFFAPMSMTFGPDAMHFVTRYEPGPATKEWVPLDMPFTGGIEPNDPLHVAWRGKRTHYDRVEITFGWIEEPTDADVAARADEGHAFKVAEKMRAERETAFYGSPPAAGKMFSAPVPRKNETWIPYPGFPINWSSARILRRFVEAYHREETQDVADRLKALGEVPADHPEAQRLRTLQRELSAFGMKMSNAFFETVNLNLKDFDAPPEDVKAKILTFFEELRVSGMPSSKERRYLHHRLPHVIDDWVKIAAIHGAEGGLTDPAGAALIPADVVSALADRHAPRKHQMFGEGEVVQVAADEMKARYVLLLQLGPDTVLDWMVGEMGPLQYWITPEDLAAKRFENTVLTIEAY